MRVWDQMPPALLCRQHLLAQWREGLSLYNILSQGKTGYANHPETKRWRGHEDALLELLGETRSAMLTRGWNPKPMPAYPTTYTSPDPAPWDDQLARLKSKACACKVPL